MNYQQIEELLPLYAGRDLDVKNAALVDVHLPSCAACAKAANEYHEAFQLTQQFAPPVFSDGVYAGMRQRVLREIETQASTPAWTHMIPSTFRPRLSWAVAGMVLIALSFFALYFLLNRGNDRKDLVNQPSSNQQVDSPAYRQAAGRPSETEREQALAGTHQAGSKKQRNPVRRRAKDSNGNSQNSLAARKQISPRTATEPAALQPFKADPSGKTLRVEIQTKDPNIRIIWFSQPNVKPVLPNSKGT